MSQEIRGYEGFTVCDIIECFCQSKDPRDIKLLTLVLVRIIGCKSGGDLREFLSTLLFPIGLSLSKHRSFLFYFKCKLRKYYEFRLLHNPAQLHANREDSSSESEYDDFYIYNLSHNSSIAEQSQASSPKPYEYTCEEIYCYSHEDCNSVQNCNEITGTRLDWDTAIRAICSTITSKKWRSTIRHFDQIPPGLALVLSQYPHFHLSTWHIPKPLVSNFVVHSSSPSGSPSNGEEEEDGEKGRNIHPPSSSSSSICLTPSTTDTEGDYAFNDVDIEMNSQIEYENTQFRSIPKISLVSKKLEFSLANIAAYTPPLGPILHLLNNEEYCGPSLKTGSSTIDQESWRQDKSFYEFLAIIYSFAKVELAPFIESIIALARERANDEISNYFDGILCDETFLLSNLVAMMFRKGRLSLHNSLYFGVLYTEPCQTTVTGMSPEDFKRKYKVQTRKSFVSIARPSPACPYVAINVDRLSDQSVTRKYEPKNGYILGTIFEQLHKISKKLLDLIRSADIFDLPMLPRPVSLLVNKINYQSCYGLLSRSPKYQKWEPYKIRYFTVESLSHLLHRQGLYLELERLNVFMMDKILEEYVWIEFQDRLPTRHELENTLSLILPQEKAISPSSFMIVQSLENRSHLVFKLCEFSLFRNVALSYVYANPKKICKNIPIFPLHIMLSYTRSSSYKPHSDEHLVSLRCLVQSIFSSITTNSRIDFSVMEVSDPLFSLYEFLPVLLSRWDHISLMQDAILDSYRIVSEGKRENCIFAILLGFIKIRSPKYLSSDSIIAIDGILKNSPGASRHFTDLCAYFSRLSYQILSATKSTSTSGKFEMRIKKENFPDLWTNLPFPGDRPHMPCVELYQLCCSSIIPHSTARNILFMIQSGIIPKHRLVSKGKQVQLSLEKQLGEYVASFGIEEDPSSYIWSRKRYIRSIGLGNEHQSYLMNFMQMIEWGSLHGKTDRVQLDDLLGLCHADPFVLSRKPMQLPVYLDSNTQQLHYYNSTLFIATCPTHSSDSQFDGSDESTMDDDDPHMNTENVHRIRKGKIREKPPVNRKQESIQNNELQQSFLLFALHHGSNIHAQLRSESIDNTRETNSFYRALKLCTEDYEKDQHRAKYVGCKFKRDTIEESPRKIRKIH